MSVDLLRGLYIWDTDISHMTIEVLLRLFLSYAKLYRQVWTWFYREADQPERLFPEIKPLDICNSD